MLIYLGWNASKCCIHSKQMTRRNFKWKERWHIHVIQNIYHEWVSERPLHGILDFACSFLVGVLFFFITLGRSFQLNRREYLVQRLALVIKESI